MTGQAPDSTITCLAQDSQYTGRWTQPVANAQTRITARVRRLALACSMLIPPQSLAPWDGVVQARRLFRRQPQCVVSLDLTPESRFWDRWVSGADGRLLS